MTTSAFHHKVQKLEDLYVLRGEASLLHSTYRRVQTEKELRALAEASRIDCPQLLSRLSDAGFDSATLPAFWIYPLAAISWASGSVTEDERRIAMLSASGLKAMESRQGASQFEAWLQAPPPTHLLKLWADCTKHRFKRGLPTNDLPTRDELTERCKEIAVTSGGFLGIGKICRAEQMILDTIREVYDDANLIG